MSDDEIIAGIQSMAEALGEFDAEDTAYYDKVAEEAEKRIRG